MKYKIIFVLVVLNFLINIGLIFFLYNNKIDDLDSQKLEYLLEKIAEKNPQFLVSLLNNSANTNAQNETQLLENDVYKNRSEILKSGFYLKKNESGEHATLVVFSDMTCAHCVTFLKNVDVALGKIDCSVVLIPISVLGEGSLHQARLITAASLQDARKALHLMISYKTFEGARNDMIEVAGKIGLDIARLTKETDSKRVSEIVMHQTKLAEKLHLPGVPSIFLLTAERAYFMPPLEANDLPDMIRDIQQQEEDE